MRRTTAFIAASFSASAALADPCEVVRLSETRWMSPSLTVRGRVDPSGVATVQEVLQEGAFRSLPSGMPNFGRTRSAVWIQICLENDEPAPADRVVTVEWPRLERVEAYAVRGWSGASPRNRWAEAPRRDPLGDGSPPPPAGAHRPSATGTASTAAPAVEPLGLSGWGVPWAERALPDPAHPFLLSLEPLESVMVLFRIRSPTEVLVPVQVFSYPQLVLRERLHSLMAGAYCGMVLALAGYNVLVFLRLRLRHHLLYAASAFIFIPWWLMNAGWMGWVPGLVEHLEVITALLGGAFYGLRVAFTRSFLRLGLLAPRLDRGLGWLQWVGIPAVLAVLLLTLEPAERDAAWPLVEIPLASVTVLAGVVAWRSGVTIARWFLPATTLLLLGFVLGHVIFFGLLVNPAFAGLSILLGMLAELVVLTLALTERAREVALQREHVLRQATAHRLTALEDLVAGVVHELNSPLGVLRSTADSFTRVAERLGSPRAAGLERAPPRGSGEPQGTVKAQLALPTLVAASRTATDRIEQVVRALQSYARLDESAVGEVDLAQGLRTALLLLRAKTSPSVEIRADLPALPPLRCRPAELNQVFTEILTNAVEAMPGGGRLEVMAAPSAEGVEIVIADSGVGIPPEERGRLFEPHLVRKGARVKMGLGLSIAKGIVDAHGGDIDIESEVGRGTRVTVRLPAHPPVEKPPTPGRL